MEQIYEDGRSLRAKNIYDDKHKKLVNTAIELLNNPLIPNEKINLSLIAKHAGTSVATAYNHFPDNLMDVYGSIFSIAFQDIVKKVEEYNQTEPNPLKRINYYIDIQVEVCIALGTALKEGFFQFREILNSNKWIQGEPYSFLLKMCEEYEKVNSAIDPTGGATPSALSCAVLVSRPAPNNASAPAMPVAALSNCVPAASKKS